MSDDVEARRRRIRRYNEQHRCVEAHEFDALVARVAALEAALRAENTDLWASREEWRTKRSDEISLDLAALRAEKARLEAENERLDAIVAMQSSTITVLLPSDKAGYDRCTRDVVAWLRRGGRGDQTARLIRYIEAGEHVGAAGDAPSGPEVES